MQNNALAQMPEIQQPQEETAKRGRLVGKLMVVLLEHWKTNLMLGIALWLSWKEEFWREPLYGFTFLLLILLCALPLLDDLIEHYRRKSTIKS